MSGGGGKKVVAYFYDDELGNFYYGPQHPMKPHRIRMAHNLVLSYGLYKRMEIYRPTLISAEQMTKFHADDYVNFLNHVNPDNMGDYALELTRYNVDVDCFDDTHQLLTKTGFKFINKIAREDLVATYNPSTEEIEYHHPNGIMAKEGVHTMVDVAQQSEAANWKTDSADYGRSEEEQKGDELSANHIYLSTTTGHRWFVAESNENQFHQMKASDLLQNMDSFKVLTLARNGYSPATTNTPALMPVAKALGLATDDQFKAFLEFYGSWLKDGSIRSQGSIALCFIPFLSQDKTYILNLMKQLQLNENIDYTYSGSFATDSELEISIEKKEWVDYFSALYEHQKLGFFNWVWDLQKEQIRLLVKGLRSSISADGVSEEIYVSSVTLRDEIVQLCLHAGYGVHFSLKHHINSEAVLGDIWRIVYSDSPIATESSISCSTDVKERQFEGRVYCVNVKNHLIVARRAYKNETGVITKASRPVIIGNCPVFDGLYKFCQMYSGGSVGGAYKLNRGTADICINWAGGLHHAKKSEASGFCYINDIVLAILELLKYHQRVLYIDIDIHHGDGVEEAFYTTDRVMTVSFHKYGDYFPGTGNVHDVGVQKGKNYSLNFPLLDGMDDVAFEGIFKDIISQVMTAYKPGAIVLQCGADSLSGDRLGGFNLSLKGHGACVEYMKSFNLPLLLVGGGGYTVRNVARCWAYETGIALDVRMADELPYNNYYEYYGPDFNLHITPSNMENQNTPKYLERTKTILLEVLRQLPHVPSVQYSTAIPHEVEREEKEKDPDVRVSQEEEDKMIEDEREFYDGDKDQDGDPSLTKRIKITHGMRPE